MSLLVAATNHGELLDPAVWRRFDVTLNFTLPDHAQRAKLLRLHGVPDEVADAIGEVVEGQTFSAISRALDSARKQTILEDVPFEVALVSWALALSTPSGKPSLAIERQRRDLQALVYHGRNLSTREIADQLGTSHTTVVRSLKRLQGGVDAGT